jgi:hypothetical protein
MKNVQIEINKIMQIACTAVALALEAVCVCTAVNFLDRMTTFLGEYSSWWSIGKHFFVYTQLEKNRTEISKVLYFSFNSRWTVVMATSQDGHLIVPYASTAQKQLPQLPAEQPRNCISIPDRGKRFVP